MGKANWKILLTRFPSIESLQKAEQEQIMELDGFAEKTSMNIVQGLEMRRELIAKLMDLGLNPRQEREEDGEGLDKTGILQGKSFVLTGTMSEPRAKIAALINKAGGKVFDRIGKEVDILVLADKSSKSSKATKARNLGIELWSEKELREKISSND